MKRYSFLLVLVLRFLTVQGQGLEIRGRVTDADDHKPLAFVNLVTGDGQHGTTTDIEGNFTLVLPERVCCLRVSYVGYEPLLYHIDYTAPSQDIRLVYKPVSLREVTVFPGVNPAHRIIRLAVKNRNRNNPEKLAKFSYVSYDKMILTVDADSLMHCDTALLDSAELKMRRFLEKQNLFMMETVSRRIYIKPQLNEEKVLATKVSGFRDPIIIFMVSQLQSTFFYRDKITILSKSYVNPVSPGSIRKYIFLLEDTVIHAPGDTTYIISYRPKRNTRFDGLRGFLSINSRGWAIENVRAEPAKDTSGILVKIQQAYARIDTTWFPVQLNTDIIFTEANIENKEKTYHLVAHGIAYLKDIDLNPGIRKKDFGLYEVEIEPGATARKEKYWQQYRTSPLTQKEKETYRVIDSLGRAENFDRYADIAQTLITGSVPAGPMDIEMDKFMRYNDYEGFYLGAGLHTNRRFSKVIRIGGFGGYGFRDKTAKYGVSLSFNIHKPSESKIRFDYYYKALASGGTSFAGEKFRVTDINDYSEFFTRRMNMTEGLEAHYGFRLRPLRDFKWDLGFIRQNKAAFGNYMYTPFSATDTTQRYHFTLVTAEVRFVFREKMIQTTRGAVSLGSDYPEVRFKYTRGLRGVWKGDFSYNRYDLRISDIVRTNYYGDLIWSLRGGIVTGNTPATQLFAATGTYRDFTVYAPNAFSTMRSNEFLSDRYASLFLTWDFRDLLVHIRQWKPRLLLLTNITIGNLSHPAHHVNYDFKTLSKGYYESGLVIRRLLFIKPFTDLGLGVMYRYGPYRFPSTKDNFAYMISVLISL